MQRLTRTVGQHNISGLDMVAILPWLHLAVHLVRGVFVFEEGASSSSQVVVQIVNVIDE